MQQFMDTFRAEAAGLVNQLEQTLLQLEKTPTDAQAVRTAFQAAHSLKGAAAMLELQDVRILTHAMESVLQLGRETSLHSLHVALLLDALDLLRDLLTYAAPGQATDPKTQQLAERLSASVSSASMATTEGVDTPTEQMAEHAIPEKPLALLVEPSQLAARGLRWQLEQLDYRVECRDIAEVLPGMTLALVAGAAAGEDTPERLAGVRWLILSECPQTRARWSERQIPALPRPPLGTPVSVLASLLETS